MPYSADEEDLFRFLEKDIRDSHTIRRGGWIELNKAEDITRTERFAYRVERWLEHLRYNTRVHIMLILILSPVLVCGIIYTLQSSVGPSGVR